MTTFDAPESEAKAIMFQPEQDRRMFPQQREDGLELPISHHAGGQPTYVP